VSSVAPIRLNTNVDASQAFYERPGLAFGDPGDPVWSEQHVEVDSLVVGVSVQQPPYEAVVSDPDGNVIRS
jgi:hypothetical protein